MNALINFYQHLPEKIDPTIFSIGQFQLRWYSLSYILGFITVYFLVRYRFNTDNGASGPKMTQENIDDLIFYAILGTVLGARLGYVFFYTQFFCIISR